VNAPDIGAKCKKDIVWQANSTAELFLHPEDSLPAINRFYELHISLSRAIKMISSPVGHLFYVDFSSAHV
jgi:hypothetical protein